MAKRQMTPYELGIRVFFDKKYIWLLNPDGVLCLHGLHRAVPDKEGERLRQELLKASEVSDA